MVMLASDLQAKADVALAALVDALVARQAGFKGKAPDGRYRQLLPGGDWKTWEDLKPVPADVTAWVDQYRTPDGAVGYVVCGHVTDAGGVVWQRCINAKGPETWRSQDWLLVPEV